MKSLLALCLSLFAVVPALAQSLTATEALEGLLPLKLYSGKTAEGDRCAVVLMKREEGINVIASANGVELSKFIHNEGPYRLRGGRYFMNSERINYDDTEYVEKTFMTRAITEDTQYMTVEHMVVSGRRNVRTTIECEVDL